MHTCNHPQSEQNPRLTRAHFLPSSARLHPSLLCPPDWFHKLGRTTSHGGNSEQSRPPRMCVRCLVCDTRQGPSAPAPTWNKASCPQYVGKTVSDSCPHGASTLYPLFLPLPLCPTKIQMVAAQSTSIPQRKIKKSVYLIFDGHAPF